MTQTYKPNLAEEITANLHKFSLRERSPAKKFFSESLLEIKFLSKKNAGEDTGH